MVAEPGARAREHLRKIFTAAVERVDPRTLLRERLRLRGETLRISGAGLERAIDLRDFDRIFVLGAGKATARLAAALEELLADRISAGVIAVKYGYTEPLRRIRIIEAGHPLPDEQGLKAAAEIEQLAGQADSRTLVIALISGGGSALLPAPLAFQSGEGAAALTLEEKQQATGALLACGATIGEINCIRKHLSRLKGGRLARLLYPAACLSLILSDVVGDRLDAIASGLTVPDPSTYAQARSIIRKYGLEKSLPRKVLDLLSRGDDGLLEETPKPGDPIFANVTNVLLGTNYTGLKAAKAMAKALGYATAVLSSRIVGEAREVARVYAAIALDQKRLRCLVPAGKPACILGGGETTVTLRGGGQGGRNQECALAFLAELQEAAEAAREIYFLSASTDGSDGPTDAAGAFASYDAVIRSRELGMSILEYLRANDSYRFHQAMGGLLKTGPTNTNVCDYQICLVL